MHHDRSRSGVGEEDFVLCMEDVRTMQGLGQGFFDHHVALCKIGLVGAWIRERLWIGLEVRN